MPDPFSRLHEELKDLGLQQLDLGDYEEALRWFDQALEQALRGDDVDEQDLALCNRAAILVAMQRGAAEVPRLREVLLRSSNGTNCRLAAYNIATHYDFANETKKALFYARIALERSRQLARPEWISSSLNQTGNILLADSLVREAVEHYEKALALMPLGDPVRRNVILINLGYCRILEGRSREGLGMLYAALRELRRRKAKSYVLIAHLDLCFGLLEVGKPRAAHRHGEAALALAEALGEQDGVKNALYLLGEAANLSGDDAEAGRHFRRLQQTFYPDSDFLPSFLLSVDVRKLVNLHA